MWKFLGTLAIMAVSGIVTYAATIGVLMELGSKLHGNKDYYGGVSALILLYGFGAIGFVVPGVVVWYLHRRATKNGR